MYDFLLLLTVSANPLKIDGYTQPEAGSVPEPAWAHTMQATARGRMPAATGARNSLDAFGVASVWRSSRAPVKTSAGEAMHITNSMLSTSDDNFHGRRWKKNDHAPADQMAPGRMSAVDDLPHRRWDVCTPRAVLTSTESSTNTVRCLVRCIGKFHRPLHPRTRQARKMPSERFRRPRPTMVRNVCAHCPACNRPFSHACAHTLNDTFSLSPLCCLQWFLWAPATNWSQTAFSQAQASLRCRGRANDA